MNITWMHVTSKVSYLQAQKVGVANTQPLGTSTASVQKCILQHRNCVQAVYSAEGGQMKTIQHLCIGARVNWSTCSVGWNQSSQAKQTRWHNIQAERGVGSGKLY